MKTTMPLHSPLRLFLLLLVGGFMVAVPAAATEYAGDWVLKIAYTGLETGQPTTFPMPPSPSESASSQNVVILSIRKKEVEDDGTHRYGVSIQVANQFGTSMNILRNSHDSDNGDAIDMSGPIMSTRMMPPPPLRDMERLIATTIPTMTQISLLGDGTLQFKGPDTIFLCQPVEAARKDE